MEKEDLIEHRHYWSLITCCFLLSG